MRDSNGDLHRPYTPEEEAEVREHMAGGLGARPCTAEELRESHAEGHLTDAELEQNLRAIGQTHK